VLTIGIAFRKACRIGRFSAAARTNFARSSARVRNRHRRQPNRETAYIVTAAMEAADRVSPRDRHSKSLIAHGGQSTPPAAASASCSNSAASILRRVNRYAFTHPRVNARARRHDDRLFAFLVRTQYASANYSLAGTDDHRTARGFFFFSGAPDTVFKAECEAPFFKDLLHLRQSMGRPQQHGRRFRERPSIFGQFRSTREPQTTGTWWGNVSFDIQRADEDCPRATQKIRMVTTPSSSSSISTFEFDCRPL